MLTFNNIESNTEATFVTGERVECDLKHRLDLFAHSSPSLKVADLKLRYQHPENSTDWTVSNTAQVQLVKRLMVWVTSQPFISNVSQPVTLASGSMLEGSDH